MPIGERASTVVLQLSRNESSAERNWYARSVIGLARSKQLILVRSEVLWDQHNNVVHSFGPFSRTAFRLWHFPQRVFLGALAAVGSSESRLRRPLPSHSMASTQKLRRLGEP